ncbi:Protein of unknown function [Gryllus bimaculatus]|nr:Protein of unknown function [Gryllus bimaculatus]
MGTFPSSYSDTFDATIACSDGRRSRPKHRTSQKAITTLPGRGNPGYRRPLPLGLRPCGEVTRESISEVTAARCDTGWWDARRRVSRFGSTCCGRRRWRREPGLRESGVGGGDAKGRDAGRGGGRECLSFQIACFQLPHRNIPTTFTVVRNVHPPPQLLPFDEIIEVIFANLDPQVVMEVVVLAAMIVAAGVTLYSGGGGKGSGSRGLKGSNAGKSGCGNVEGSGGWRFSGNGSGAHGACDSGGSIGSDQGEGKTGEQLLLTQKLPLLLIVQLTPPLFSNLCFSSAPTPPTPRRIGQELRNWWGEGRDWSGEGGEWGGECGGEWAGVGGEWRGVGGRIAGWSGLKQKIGEDGLGWNEMVGLTLDERVVRRPSRELRMSRQSRHWRRYLVGKPRMQGGRGAAERGRKPGSGGAGSSESTSSGGDRRRHHAERVQYRRESP